VLTTRTRSRLPRTGAVTPGPRSGSVRSEPVAFERLGLKGRANAGIAAPVAFTSAWVVASLLQAGHCPAEVQISGLAAPGYRF
jgi:hypothetical protein